ncbi:LOW QUALITY PROTEIN: phospholipid-transporting ATPase ABCA3-like [Littorina saxatilis]
MLVGSAVVEEWSGQNVSVRWQTNRMPYPPYVEDGMATLLMEIMPAFIMLSFILPVIQYTKGIVHEKERKLKESMKLMGLLPSAHWAAWFFTCMIFMVITMAIYTVFLGVSFSDNGPAIGNSDITLFFVFMLVYAVAIVTYCFMMSSVIQKANIAAVVGGLVYFGLYIPYIFLNQHYETTTYSEKMAVGLLFNSAMALGMKVIGLYVGTGEGISWSKIAEPAISDDNFSFQDVLIMLLVDSAIHLTVTWYLDNVWPGEFGVPKPFYFPFTKSYWCGLTPQYKNTGLALNTDDEHFESEPQGLKAGISVDKLRKEFGKNKVAVNNVSLKMYEGQITVLLGHNGAGKTTTMFMLTGFLPPSSGTAIINGLDIRSDMDTIRHDLGLCPQHNILFDAMTVEEHLDFFARLKGCPASRVKEEVDKILTEVGLEFKRHAQSQTLSGGQKRKLSVGIALINDSKVVILDEPTSGMDPASRRQTWDVLQRHRAGRTMLLTTHFMDEADLLGDRIAIMAEGVVQCCGSSMFLKKLYGTGYHLVLVKKQSCHVDKVTSVIQQHIPAARFESEINTELSYLLPDDQAALFPDLFRQLEAHKEELGIGGFGTTATTLEEVFLKVGEICATPDEDSNEETQHSRASVTAQSGASNGYENLAFTNDPKSYKGNGVAVTDKNVSLNIGGNSGYVAADILSFNHGFNKLTGMSLQLSRFRAMVTKKMLHTWRNRLITLLQMILPVACGVVALVVDSDFVTPEEQNQPLNFTLSPFGRTYVPYSNGTNPTTASAAAARAYALQIGKTQSLEDVNLESDWANMSEYLLLRAKNLGTNNYNKKVVIGAQFDSDNAYSLLARAYYNGQPFHALPTSVSYLLDGLARHFAGPDHRISTGLDLFPKNQELEVSVEKTQATIVQQGFVIGMIVSFGMAFLVSSFVYLVVKERQVGAKHLQEVSGVGPIVFWGANFAWDYCNYLIASLFLVIVFAGFNPEAYTGDSRLGIVVLVLMLYGWAVLPFMYLFSFLFSQAPTALVLTIIYNVLSGTVTTMVVTFMTSQRDLKDVGHDISWVFLVLSPNHCFGISLMDMYTNYNRLDFCTKRDSGCVCLRSPSCCKGPACLDFSDNYFSFEYPGIGRSVFFMALQGFVFMTLTLLIEFHVPQRLAYFCRGKRGTSYRDLRLIMNMQLSVLNGTVTEDSDVAEERRRINSTDIDELCKTDSLLMVNLYKHYGDLVAVDHLSVGVKQQECFGLLGQNGAGKTTTFKMLTGQVMASSGNAYVKGHDTKNNIKQVQSNLGYCPQFDALHDQLTGRETLTMTYARLRGVPSENIDDVVNSLIDILLLHSHADKLSSAYSGGTKRKLSTAISLVGDPAFILLDEPSSGMDPAARRHLWNVLSQVRASGRTLLLTSHSMDECDALCTRIAIMVNGSMLCLGSPQHLKNKFGQGYTLVAKMDTSDNEETGDNSDNVQQEFISFVQSSFPSAVVFEAHHGYVHLQVPDPNVQLADMFALMERAKREQHVQDYTVHTTTLEQVFLAFARRQNPPKEHGTTGSLAALKKCCSCGEK